MACIAPYGFLWTTYHCSIRRYLKSRGAEKCREEIPSDLSIPGGEFSSSTKAYQSRYIFLRIRCCYINYFTHPSDDDSGHSLLEKKLDAVFELVRAKYGFGAALQGHQESNSKPPPQRS